MTSHAITYAHGSGLEDDAVGRAHCQHSGRAVHTLRRRLTSDEARPVAVAFAQLGYPLDLAVGIGILELACLAIYVTPRTSLLGAILLTGYLGGAVASQLRVGHSFFEKVFPIILGVLFWGGLFFRDGRVRTIIALRSYTEES